MSRVSAFERLAAARTIVAVALVVLPFLEGFRTLAAGTVLLSSILGYGTITLPYMTAAFPSDMQGTGLGVLRTVYLTIGAASPVLFGALADRGFFDEGYLLLAGLAVVAIGLTRALPEE